MSPFPWAGLPHVHVQNLPLSREALRFWKHALSTDPQPAGISQYPLIKRIFGEPVSAQGGVQKQTVSCAPAAIISHPPDSSQGNAAQKEDLGTRLRNNLLPLALVLPVFSLCGVLAYVLFSGDGQSTYPTDKTTDGTRPNDTLTPSPPVFDRQEQRDIYSKLRAGEKVVLDDIPTGSKVSGERMETFLADLAQVLRKTNMSVTIRVHTDSSGDVAINKSTSEQRAIDVRDWLETKGQITPGRVKYEATGKASPVVGLETPDQEKRNRRLEVVAP
jgi:outer membrane protein OmpA-like peptidoglycan-associated protein